ncbi:MAG: sodium/solute symporter [Cytophagaceae bacterium]|jgi:SSS family solute:Na+ symporter|nr:sodium/solute symporter [Cytophagaceae bacterium]
MLNTFSVVTLVSFFAICCIAAFYYSKGKISLSEYFVSFHHYPWYMVGFIAFLSNTSTNSLFSFTTKTAKLGIAAFNAELTGILCCIFLALVFGRVYHHNNFYTTSQYVEMRYNRVVGYITSFLLILMSIVARISAILVALHLVIHQFFGIDIYTTSILMIMFCGVYSIVGGQRTIIMTSVLIGFVILCGTLLFTVFVLKAYGSVSAEYPPHYFTLFRPPVAGELYTWPGVVFGLPILGIWFHCINQTIVQSYFASKSEYHFQSGALLHGYLKLLVFPLTILPGIYLFTVAPQYEGQTLYASMISTLIPDMLKGLVVAATVGTAMITLSASFNACSTLFTFDFYKKIFPDANDFMITNVGKIATIVVAIFSMIWMVMMNAFHADVPHVITSSLTYFTPPIVAVYLMGIFWERATARAATWALILGFIIGLTKFYITFKGAEFWETGSWLQSIAMFNIYNFTVVLFVFSLVLIVAISFMDVPPPLEQIKSLLFAYNRPELNAHQKRIYFFAALLALIVLGIYLRWGF